MNTKIRTNNISQYSLKLFDVFENLCYDYYNKGFSKINIPKLPVFTMEEGIKIDQISSKIIFRLEKS